MSEPVFSPPSGTFPSLPFAPIGYVTASAGQIGLYACVRCGALLSRHHEVVAAHDAFHVRIGDA